MENTRICVELLPPDNDSNLPPSNLVLPALGSGPLELAMDKSAYWRPGTQLHVLFISGSTFVKNKVKFFAQTWEKYANIDFVFDDSASAQIRISFVKGGGSWSYLGRHNLQIPSDRPTMNFGWFDDNSTDEELSRTTIHEFGHALGCIHEHMSPAASIPWDKEKVYKYFMGPPNSWTKEDVDRNLFNKYAVSAAYHTAFDSLSIMLYRISNDLTIGDFETPNNTVLSPTDKVFIRSLYPEQTRNRARFSTQDFRPSSNPKLLNATQVNFEPEYAEPPTIAVGLTELDLKQRVQLASTDTEFQLGNFDTLELHAWNEAKPQNTKRVVFERSFTEPPKVVVWLQGFDMDKQKCWKIGVHASNISSEGFDVHIDTWGESQLYSGSASWIAYPADKTGIVSGVVDSSISQEQSLHGQYKGGRVDFPRGIFDRKHRVHLAIKSFNCDNKHDLRLKAVAENVSKDGFDWKVETWSNSVLNGAGISYLDLAMSSQMNDDFEVSLNDKDKTWKPLHFATENELENTAAEHGSKALTRFLPEKGINKEAKSQGGRAPLHYAAEGGYELVAQLLLKVGADKEAKDSDSWTPLQYAAAKGTRQSRVFSNKPSRFF
ncbi:Peptidase M12A, astacin [Penicillium expansum]|nr:Peptidase M12A, astacin [Penicillium expansum]